MDELNRFAEELQNFEAEVQGEDAMYLPVGEKELAGKADPELRNEDGTFTDCAAKLPFANRDPFLENGEYLQ